MYKIILIFFIAIACVSECSVINVSSYATQDEFELSDSTFLRTDDGASNFGPHIMDFLKLIDVEKMAMVAMQYMSDPEVMMFMKFLFSPQFKEIIWNFETMEEFKEAFEFLESKGYDMESIINFVNTALKLPPFEKPNYVLRNEKGISGFLEAMISTLPLEDMKKLFESKLETSPEVADLFEIIHSEEFMGIMRRMKENPKFAEIKMIFEAYGFDFKFICKMIKDIAGEYYQGVFCE